MAKRQGDKFSLFIKEKEIILLISKKAFDTIWRAGL
jgi:hypothetical protein